MIKNLLNKNVLRAMGAVLMVCFMAVGSFGQMAGEFRSKNPSGTWTTITDWETYDGAAWNTAVAIPSGSSLTEIRAGNTMIIAANLSLTNPVTVNGTVSNAFIVTLSGVGSFTFNSGSFYLHTGATNTVCVMPASTWMSGSTCKVTGTTSAVNLNLAAQLTPVHHFIWDCASQSGNLNLASNSG